MKSKLTIPEIAVHPRFLHLAREEGMNEARREDLAHLVFWAMDMPIMVFMQVADSEDRYRDLRNLALSIKSKIEGNTMKVKIVKASLLSPTSLAAHTYVDPTRRIDAELAWIEKRVTTLLKRKKTLEEQRAAILNK